MAADPVQREKQLTQGEREALYSRGRTRLQVRFDRGAFCQPVLGRRLSRLRLQVRFDRGAFCQPVLDRRLSRFWSGPREVLDDEEARHRVLWMMELAACDDGVLMIAFDRRNPLCSHEHGWIKK